MTLYTYFRSSASFRVRIALNLKGIDADQHAVSLLKGDHRKDFLSLNPQGFLPAYRDGDAVLTQSMAIIDYLEDCHPHPPLYPETPLARARVRAMAQVIACDIHPLNNLRVLKYLKGELGLDQDGINQWYRHWIMEGFAALEAMVADHGGTQYCFGEQVSVADLCLVPQMWNARRFETDLSPYPRLVAIDAHVSTLDAFAKAMPEVQPDAL